MSYENFHAGLRNLVRSSHAQLTPAVPKEKTDEIADYIFESLKVVVSPTDLTFYTQMNELANYIKKAKAEIALIKPDDISKNYVPKATDELDAVVMATEEATNSIMDVCDAVALIAEECPEELKNRLIECNTKIFEACNFQDITGQRITKVVQALKHIDEKISAMLKVMVDEIQKAGGAEPDLPAAPEPEAHPAKPETLLNGPQLPKDSMSQDDIDKILSGG